MPQKPECAKVARASKLGAVSSVENQAPRTAASHLLLLLLSKKSAKQLVPSLRSL